MLKNIEADKAMEILVSLPVRHETETVALKDALERVTAAPLTARVPVPPFDRSPYDGYAFRGEDTALASPDNPVTLEITEEIPAGKQPEREIMPGQAAKILTGAPIPRGANTTVKYEDTEYTDTHVRISKKIAPDTDIVYAGGDVGPGQEITPAGTVITGPVAAAAASQGFATLEVVRKPLITIINTGSELLEAGAPLEPAKIYNSNLYTISGYLTRFGSIPINGGIAEDEPSLIAGRIGAALETSDMVITSGGASVGDYDWAVASAEILGAEVLFWKVSMKPGGAIMAAVKNGKLILGLSGNPGAAVIGLLRIASPYIKKLCGRADIYYPTAQVIIKEPLKKKSPKLRLLRGRLELLDTRAYFAENTGRGNDSVTSLIECDLLGEIPLGSPPLPAGTIIKAYRI